MVLVVDFAAVAGAFCGAVEAAAGAGVVAAGAGAAGALAAGAAGAPGALAAGAVAAGAGVVAGAAGAGSTESVTPLPCDQALLVGSVMSADNNKIREIFMAKNLGNVD